MINKKTFCTLLFVLLPITLFSLSINIRHYDHSDFTRIVLEANSGFEYSYTPSNKAIEIRLNQRATLKQNVEIYPKSKYVDRIEHRTLRKTSKSVFKILLREGVILKRNFVLERPFRVIFDLEKKREKSNSSNPVSQPVTSNTGNFAPKSANAGLLPGKDPQQDKPETPTLPPSTEREKRHAITSICIDPGHGGNDFGAVGKSGIMEKDITLKIADKLKKIVESKLGLEVIMTREKDEEISLNSRVAKANNQKAQLFVSIHINSSFRKSANGSETFYVSLKATDQDALALSQKENESESGDEQTENQNLPTEINNELKMILWNMAQTEYIKESSVLADYIQAELNVLLDTANRGVKQAPFRVLMRAAMPAVLVEIAFVSNPAEEKKLSSDEFLNNVASAIYTGISKFITYYNSTIK